MHLDSSSGGSWGKLEGPSDWRGEDPMSGSPQVTVVLLETGDSNPQEKCSGLLQNIKEI